MISNDIILPPGEMKIIYKDLLVFYLCKPLFRSFEVVFEAGGAQLEIFFAEITGDTQKGRAEFASKKPLARH